MTPPGTPQEKAMRESANRAMNTLLLCVFFLTAAGWVMLLDCGLIFEGRPDPAHFANLVSKRTLCTAIGVVLLGIMWIAPPDKIRKFSPFVIALAIFLLAIVWTPLGVAERGSRRWVSIGPFTFQPLEIAKPALIWFLADRLARVNSLGRIDVNSLLAPGLAVVLVVALVGLQPNLSGAVFLILLAFAMACIGGINRRLAITLTFAGTAACSALLALNPDRIERFLPVVRPLTDLSGSGYQVGLSLWAITGGGLFGRGPGGSIAMYSLPDHTTDFTFSIICEEWGLIGGVAVIILFALLIYSGFRIALVQHDPFRLLLGCGLTAIIGLQAAINIGVTLGLLPTTGVPLPFLSAGGSNLIVSLAAIGLLLNLGRTAGIPIETQSKKDKPVETTTTQKRPNQYRRTPPQVRPRDTRIPVSETRRRVAR